MPLFSRPDGTLVRGLGLVRRMIPFMMPTRNEAVVYYEQILDVSETLPFIARYNEAGSHRITIFHVVLAALARGLKARPGLDRFVSGSYIYQRKHTELAFAVKKQFKDDAPLVTVKLAVEGGEAFDAMVARLAHSIGDSRTDTVKPVDKELKLAFLLPGFLLRWAMRWVRFLDRWNLLPMAFIKNDPLYSSLFVANLGSLGIDRVWHHLYEYGTCSLFCAIGAVRREVVVGEGDALSVKPTLSLRFAFDERINDGHYCVRALQIVRDHIEQPTLLLGPWPEVVTSKAGRG